MEIKALTLGDEYTFTACVNKHDIIDRLGDMSRAGCWEATLAQNPNTIQLLADPDGKEHNHQRLPIGVVTAVYENAYGLFIDGRFNKDDQLAMKIHSLLKQYNNVQDAPICFSIGYNVLASHNEAINGQAVRIFDNVKVIECSIVNAIYAVNQQSTFIDVKSMDENNNNGGLTVDENEKIKQLETEVQELKSMIAAADQQVQQQQDNNNIEMNKGGDKMENTFAVEFKSLVQQAAKGLVNGSAFAELKSLVIGDETLNQSIDQLMAEQVILVARDSSQILSRVLGEPVSSTSYKFFIAEGAGKDAFVAKGENIKFETDYYGTTPTATFKARDLKFMKLVSSFPISDDLMDESAIANSLVSTVTLALGQDLALKLGHLVLWGKGNNVGENADPEILGIMAQFATDANTKVANKYSYVKGDTVKKFGADEQAVQDLMIDAEMMLVEPYAAAAEWCLSRRSLLELKKYKTIQGLRPDWFEMKEGKVYLDGIPAFTEMNMPELADATQEMCMILADWKNAYTVRMHKTTTKVNPYKVDGATIYQQIHKLGASMVVESALVGVAVPKQ